MHDNLIILGAGATAAISEGKLPTAKNFFTSNAEWSNHISDFPHLKLACDKVEHLKYEDSNNNPITLTDIWFFIDTLNKYHMAVASNAPDNKQYNSKLLRLRYNGCGQRLPYYLSPGYLNAHYKELCADLRPLFSTLEKQIYTTFASGDPVNYFLILAGWELKYLLYKTYHPESNKVVHLYLYEKLANNIPVSVINLNYDIYFEKACMTNSQKLQLANKDEKTDEDTIYLCKPHGGWNIKHIDCYIEPCCALHDYVHDDSFDKKETCEIRPAMIPYFESPDEIKAEHVSVYPGVGKYFLDQQEIMKIMFEAAKNIVSIGYCFSNDDKHVAEILKKCKDNNKRLFCILKEVATEEFDRIEKQWKHLLKSKEGFQYSNNGFNKKSNSVIKKFLNNT